MKPKLDRVGPERHPGGIYKSPHVDDGSKGPAGIVASEDAVVHGVRVGYRVIDEQLKRGQRYARKLRQSYERDGGHWGNAVDGGLDLMREAGRLSGEWMESALRTGRIRMPGREPAQAPRASNARDMTAQMLASLVEGLGLTMRTGDASSAARAAEAGAPTRGAEIPAFVLGDSIAIRVEAIRIGSAWPLHPPDALVVLAQRDDWEKLQCEFVTGANGSLECHVDAQKLPPGRFQTMHAVFVDRSNGEPCAKVTVRFASRNVAADDGERE
jgi:hypothetical protein